MRKLLSFLVLFGAGLLLLTWLQEKGKPVVEEEIDEPPVEQPTGERPVSGVSLSGPFTGNFFNKEGAAVLSLESLDSRSEGPAHHLEGVTGAVLDPTDPERAQATFEAERARVESKQAGEGPLPVLEPVALLTGLTAHFEEGSPVGPVTMETSEASLDLRDPNRGRMSSAEPITFYSEHLRGESAGWDFEFAGVFVLREKAAIDFERPGDDAVRLEAERGPIQIHRERGAGRRPVRIEAFGGARLRTDALVLAADHIHAEGSSSEDGSGLRFRALEAVGSVVWEWGDHVFRGESATMAFSEAGEPERVVLRAREGERASARLVLALEQEPLPGVAPEDVAGAVLVLGSEIEVLTGERTTFTVESPAELQTKGVRLRSAGPVTGWIEEEEQKARFLADRGVVLEADRATLETPVFELTLDRDLLLGEARGGPALRGNLEDGSKFSVTSPDRLVVEREGERLRVVEGTDVEVAVDGPKGFRARADRVSELDVEAYRLRADGQVGLTQDERSWTGEQLDVLSEDRFVLRGTAGEGGGGATRARYDGPEGWAEALLVERDGTQLYASGDVVCDLDALAIGNGGGGGYDRYQLSCGELWIEGDDKGADEPERQLRVEASGAVHGTLTAEDGPSVLDCQRLVVEHFERTVDEGEIQRETLLTALGSVEAALAFVETAEDEPRPWQLDLSCEDLNVRVDEVGGVKKRTILAKENVRFRGDRRGSRPDAEIEVSGEGEVLTLDANGHGTLVAPKTGRVKLRGALPSHELPFRLTARRVTFDLDKEIRAEEPSIAVQRQRARARELVATRESLELVGDVRVSGSTSQEPWTLDAGRVRFEGRRDEEAGSTDLRAIDASEGVRFHLGTTARATGDRLVARGGRGLMRLTGSPAFIVAPVACYEAEWIDFDPELQIIVATGRGRIVEKPPRAARGDGGPGGPGARGQEEQDDDGSDQDWSLEFLSSSTLVEPDSLIYVLQEPTFRYKPEDAAMRASWSVLWIDRQSWPPRATSADEGQESGRPSARPEGLAGTKNAGPLQVFFQFLEANEITGVVREAYFEGPVEVLSQGDFIARADAVYLDLVSGHGWLANATVNILGRLIGQDFEKLTVKADWLRHSADGSLRADSATVTSCDFEEPHVRVVTGDLRITPIGTPDETQFEMALRDNRIELFGLPRIPLPAIAFDTDEDLKPLWPSFRIGNSARLGNLLSLEFDRPAKGVSNSMEKRTGVEHDANYHIDVSYLGSRGGLLDLGLDVEAQEKYWFDLYVGIIPDRGEDKGYLRVPEDERDDIRLWLRSQGRLNAGKSLLDWHYTDQSDYGVQSEFYESEFVHYERAESYVQWKRAHEHTYLQASVEARTDSFRTDVEELPGTLAFRGRAPLFHVGKFPIVHTGDARAEYLRRREGRATTLDEFGNRVPLASPFGLPATFPDGLGNREVLRFDSSQRLETAIPLGFGGLRLVPFSGFRATAWDEAIDPSESASRFFASAGARLSTTLWKRGPDGSMNQIVPHIAFTDVFGQERHRLPVRYDEIEDRVESDSVEVGTRVRLGVQDGRSRLDLSLVGKYADDRPGSAGSGWLPIEVLGRLDLEPFGKLFEIWHDGRYDVETGETVYSLAALGTRIGDKAGLQIGHQVGRDRARERHFEAATVAGFYRWTEKWEFEAREAFSLLEDQGLDFGLVIRRYGHDVIFDFEFSIREGEGTSFSFSLEPRLGYRPSRIGYLNW